MKKWLILIIALTLISCSNQSNKEADNMVDQSAVNDQEIISLAENVQVDKVEEVAVTVDNSTNDTTVGDELTVPNNNDELAAIEDAYDFDYQNNFIIKDYIKPDYTVDSNQEQLNYIEIENPEHFTNFSSDQLDMLNRNGFVVLQPSEEPRFKLHTAYESMGYNEVPIFVTSDVILHMYHIFYSETMKNYEISLYYPELKKLTEKLSWSAVEAYHNADVVKEDLKYVSAYYGVAATLLGINIDYPDEIQQLIDSEIEKINRAEDYNNNSILNRKVDYSQYIVRGHYSMSDEFADYFRAMMWYGQAGFILVDEDKADEKDARVRSLIATALLFNDTSEQIKSYTAIYDLTSLYSSYSDDLNVYDLAEMIKEVYGTQPDLDMFRESSYDAHFDEVLNKSRTANVISQNGESGVEFRFMGQRYTLDAEVMQNLVNPLHRLESTSFDFFSALGNETAEKVLRENYQTNQNWSEFDDVLEQMKEKVNTFDSWNDNLYHGWLWAIKSTQVNHIDDTSMPFFMQTDAWAYKSLATGLGSFTELKHDNILYSKQVMAECGDGDRSPDLFHYVEPNVELYSRLLWLTETTYNNINAMNQSLSKNDSYYEIEAMIELLKVCRDVSIKEIQNEEVTQEEMKIIDKVGGVIDYLNRAYLHRLYEYCPDVSDEHTSALIADIATIKGEITEVAIGLPMDIYVLCEINGKKLLTRGAVYSFYEFKNDTRLTDEQWQNMLGLYRSEEEGFLRTYYNGPTLNIIEYMPWMAIYISNDTNQVITIQREVGW